MDPNPKRISVFRTSLDFQTADVSGAGVETSNKRVVDVDSSSA